jgi:hypothetical protein
MVGGINLQLNKLEKDIVEIGKIANKVEAIIRLFQVVSIFQDAGGFKNEIAELEKTTGNKKINLQALCGLQKHLENAGRDLYGINRTQKGEEVTADKVYLGNVFGLFTHPASYWLAQRESLENTFHEYLSRDPENPVSTWYIIHDYQCGGFVDSHTTGILEKIALLKGDNAEK